MSRISTKSHQSDARQSDKGKNYKIYAVNYHGTGLDAIKVQFKKCVLTGLRRTVYLIDLDDEFEQIMTARKELQKSKSGSAVRMQDVCTIAMAAIDRCRRHYQNVMQTLENERRFDLLKYWLDNVEQKGMTLRLSKRRSQLTAPKSALATGTMRGNRKSTLRKSLEKQPSVIDALANCLDVKRKTHNQVGAAEILSNRKYIQDEPANTKLFIILTGQLSMQLYMDLLRRGEPLQAIIDFLPEICAYDLMIPHPEVREFIVTTFGEIQWSIEEFRKKSLTKPVGVFHQQLPVISKCLAEKYAAEIYSQLTWYVYDVEVLYQQYLLYYIRPFNETNVQIDNSANLQNSLDIAESLSIQGHYLKSPLPAFAVDPATILMYWDSLLSTLDLPPELITSDEAFLLTQPSKISLSYAERHSDRNMLQILQAYHNAFDSITKIKRFQRIFVEENNTLLSSLLAYCDQKIYMNIYLSCLEYNLLRQYVNTSYTRGSLEYRPFAFDYEPIFLPRYAKYYPTSDAVNQRIAALIETYDNFDVDEIYPDHKLYIFHRTYNEIFDNEKLTVIPTKLCFRDFTIYQKDEFLEALVTPEMRRLQEEEKLTEEERLQLTLHKEQIDFDPIIFIRLNSLQARKLQKLLLRNYNRLQSDQMSKRATGSKRDTKKRTLQFDRHSSVLEPLEDTYVGLPPNHPLLKGYNLENIRQEIFTRTSKYHFKEGLLKLYEERWNAVDMNAIIELIMHGTSLAIKRHRKHILTISKDLRIVTKNDISMRLKTSTGQCAKVVINYPNGLAVRSESTMVEQVWTPAETHNDEHMRIYTPYGAVIIHLNGADVTTVLRYNGEMYQLYQYELYSTEEEEEDTAFTEATERSTERRNSNLPTAKRSSKHSKRSTIGSTPKGGKRKSKTKATTVTAAADAAVVGDTVNADERPSLAFIPAPPTKTAHQLLTESVENECRFIQQLSKVYGLTYLHLKITTCTGRVVNITHRGKIYETNKYYICEWQDYFANECYALRDDGLKVVWTKDSMRCYHIDGTVIVSTCEEGLQTINEFESLITPSSSHLSEEGLEDFGSQEEMLEAGHNKKHRLNSLLKPLVPDDYTKYLNTGGEGEEGEHEDTSYITYKTDSYGMHNEHYVGVLFVLNKCDLYACNELDVLITLLAVDDVRIQLIPEESAKFPNSMFYANNNEQISMRNLYGSMHSTFNVMHDIQSLPSLAMDKLSQDFSLDKIINEQQHPVRHQVHMMVGKDFEMFMHEEFFQIDANVERNVPEANKEAEGGKTIDRLQLRVDYDTDIIPTLFHTFVDKIATFKNCAGPEHDTFYFLEKEKKACVYQGFELYDELPPMSGKTYSIGNTVTELQPLQTMNDRMLLPYEYYAADMKKFPRFHKRPPFTYNKRRLLDEYPLVTSVNIYLKIPRTLSNTEDILKFVEPLDEITFKKTRRQVKTALDFMLFPDIQLRVKILASQKNWERRKIQHQRRLFSMQQRRGLYEAMLKHKVYPKYPQFVHDFSSHAKYIDFFDFMKFNCMPVIVPTPTDQTPPAPTIETSQFADGGGVLPGVVVAPDPAFNIGFDEKTTILNIVD